MKEKIMGVLEAGVARGRALWNASRAWYAAWVRLREARYQHLASILDAATEADEVPRVLACRAAASGRRRRDER